MKNLHLTLCFLLTSLFGFSQNLTQSVRGTLIDFDTKTPIPFAQILVLESEPRKGTVSSELGEFRLDSIPLGRISLKFSAYGYQDLVIPNILFRIGERKDFESRTFERCKGNR
ncbi:MAG: carboxypeptidase regulatory-like domain-containing protein [Fluviicola sp.]